jgi:hypothetical protein
MDKDRFFTYVGIDQNGKKWLCLIVIQHGSWLYTGHEDEDGNRSWYKQQGRACDKDLCKDIKLPPWEDLSTECPEVGTAAAFHGFEFVDIIPRTRESLEKLYAEALSHIEAQAKEIQRLRLVVEQMQNLARIEYRRGAKHENIQLADRIGWSLQGLGKPEENPELAAFLREQKETTEDAS